MVALNALPPDRLLSHARAAARADEQRHPRTALHAERTLRGWGGAALLDLQWVSHCFYAPAQQAAYRQAYAEEYRRAHTTRALLSAP